MKLFTPQLEEVKAVSKLNIQKMKIVASVPDLHGQIEKVEAGKILFS